MTILRLALSRTHLIPWMNQSTIYILVSCRQQTWKKCRFLLWFWCWISSWNQSHGTENCGVLYTAAAAAVAIDLSHFRCGSPSSCCSSIMAASFISITNDVHLQQRVLNGYNSAAQDLFPFFPTWFDSASSRRTGMKRPHISLGTMRVSEWMWQTIGGIPIEIVQFCSPIICNKIMYSKHIISDWLLTD